MKGETQAEKEERTCGAGHGSLAYAQKVNRIARAMYRLAREEDHTPARKTCPNRETD